MVCQTILDHLRHLYPKCLPETFWVISGSSRNASVPGYPGEKMNWAAAVRNSLVIAQGSREAKGTPVQLNLFNLLDYLIAQGICSSLSTGHFMQMSWGVHSGNRGVHSGQLMRS